MKWQTKAGQVLELPEMGTEHLINARNQILHRIEECEGDLDSCFGHGFDPESMAAYYSEGCHIELQGQIDYLCSVRDEFNKELVGRGVPRDV